MIPASDAPSRSLLWSRIAVCVLGLGMMADVTLSPLYAIFLRPPITPPPRIRAVEGDVWIDQGWRRGDDGAYVLRLADGRSLTLYCGPAPYPFRCLHTVGLDHGQAYRLTVAYGAQVLPDGQTRNVITHAMYGPHDLVTPEQQVRAWNNTASHYDPRLGRRVVLKRDGLFWMLQAIVTAVSAMFLAGLIKNGRMLASLSRERRKV